VSSTAWLACLALAAVACRIHTPDFDDTTFACSEQDMTCPEGLTCNGTICVDDTPDAGTEVDADEACQPADNDACANAIDVTAAALAGVTLYGDTTGYANDLVPSVLPGCTESPEPGPDAIYRIDAQAGDTVHATLTPVGWNSALYLIDGCSGTATCLGGDDQFGSSTDEATIAITTADTYFLVIDSSTTSGAGCYTLQLELVR
jgi:hypothetical protein